MRALARAYRRWPTGVYLVWYPIKDRPIAEALTAGLAGIVPRKLLLAELRLFSGLPAFSASTAAAWRW